MKLPVISIQELRRRLGRLAPTRPARPLATRFPAVQYHLPRLNERRRTATTGFGVLGWIICAVGGAETMLFLQPTAGIYANAAALSSLIGLALWKVWARQLAISVAIIPLAFMLGLSLPQTTPFMRASVLYMTCLLLAASYRYLFTLGVPRDVTKLRMTRHGYLFAIPMMLVVGQVLGLLGYGLLRHQYDFAPAALPLVALTAVVFAITEETLLRGLIQQRAAQVMHPIAAAVLSALLSMVLTLGHHGGTLSPLFGLVMGASVAFVYYKKQNLLLTIALNASSKLIYIGLVAVFILRH